MAIRRYISQSIFHIVMDRPPHNALDTEMYESLTAAFAEASADQVIVLSSAARHFSAGQDLNELQRERTYAEQVQDLHTGAGAIFAALRCQAPIVAAVHGAAIGAGALLACAADVLILSEDAWLKLPELQVGVPIGAPVAARVLGGPLSRRMLLTAEPVQAMTLGAMGAATVVKRNDLEQTAVEVASKILAMQPNLLSFARKMWGMNERESAAELYQAEIDEFLKLGLNHSPE